MKIDILIRNGTVVDPANKRNGKADVALTDGKVALVADKIDPGTAQEVIDATDKLVLPGVIDSHVHLVCEGSGGVPYNMLLRRGVTTALDMMGGIDTFIDEMRVYGHGINAACLHALVIGRDVKTNNAGREEVGAAIDAALAKGAFGIKIMGGHYPFTPETTAHIIEACAKRGAYIAFHAGSTANGSNIKGFDEAVALSAGHPLHMCHVNAYCRGQVENPLLETERLLRGLEENPQIVSESYLSVMNGTSAEVNAQGIVHSAVTRTCVERGGFTSDKDGMGKAIRAGWANIYGKVGGELSYLGPEEGYAYWEKHGTNAWCSFPVNNPVALLACATARRKDGSFTVDAVSTDGGGIPRNVIFENGIRLVQARYMTIEELVHKISLAPARMLGLPNKGHLSQGADADVAVFDACSAQALYTIAGGKVRMAGGVCGDGPGTVITSKQGEKAVAAAKLPGITANLAGSTFMRGHGKA